MHVITRAQVVNILLNWPQDTVQPPQIYFTALKSTYRVIIIPSIPIIIESCAVIIHKATLTHSISSCFLQRCSEILERIALPIKMDNKIINIIIMYEQLQKVHGNDVCFFHSLHSMISMTINGLSKLRHGKVTATTNQNDLHLQKALGEQVTMKQQQKNFEMETS